jgi:hypothetical protein
MGQKSRSYQQQGRAEEDNTQDRGKSIAGVVVLLKKQGGNGRRGNRNGDLSQRDCIPFFLGKKHKRPPKTGRGAKRVLGAVIGVGCGVWLVPRVCSRGEFHTR